MEEHINPYNEALELTAEQREIYEQSLLQYRDLRSVVATAMQDSKIEVAKMMLADNEPNEKVAKYTGLTVEQIQRLRNERK